MLMTPHRDYHLIHGNEDLAVLSVPIPLISQTHQDMQLRLQHLRQSQIHPLHHDSSPPLPAFLSLR